MIRLRNKTYTCPVDVTLSFIGGKWKLLSQQLKELEKDGLVKKEIITRKPYRVKYQLTPSGKEFGPFYRFASKWGINYLKANGIEYEQDQHLYK
jgi:DNA-binding HxlR family transcriptional regulator